MKEETKEETSSVERMSKKIGVKMNKDSELFHVELKIDYNGCNREELIARAFKTDTIRMQSKIRKMKEKELESIRSSGLEVTWEEVAEKVARVQKTPLQVLVDSGIPEKLAKKILANPELFQEEEEEKEEETGE